LIYFIILFFFQSKKEARDIEQSANTFFGQMNNHFGGGSADLFGDSFNKNKKMPPIRNLEPL
jgi:hypothetical protein